MRDKFDSFLQKHLKTKNVKKEQNINYKMKELKELLSCSIELLKNEPSLGEINPPCVIVGDIHGQYFDLIRMFAMFSRSNSKQHGALSQRYMFLGDYIDRGRRSLECICLVLALKLCHPTKFILLRGNHESRNVNRSYGFYEELIDRFEQNDADILYHGFNEVFDWLPLAGLVGRRILCMHGGLSDHLNSFEDIKNIPRPLEDPNTIPLARDLLWADPMFNLSGFAPNSIRGIACYFGEDAVKITCEKLGIDLIVRAHQMIMAGYGFFANRKLCTIFTAPRYQTDLNNHGAVMFVSREGKIGFKVLAPGEPEDKEETKPKNVGETLKAVPAVFVHEPRRLKGIFSVGFSSLLISFRAFLASLLSTPTVPQHSNHFLLSFSKSSENEFY